MLSCWWRWCLRWGKWVNIWGINQELLWVILCQKLYNLLNGITSIPFWYLGNRRNFCVYINRSLNSWENHWTKRDIVHETMFDWRMVPKKRQGGPKLGVIGSSELSSKRYICSMAKPMALGIPNLGNTQMNMYYTYHCWQPFQVNLVKCLSLNMEWCLFIHKSTGICEVLN